MIVGAFILAAFDDTKEVTVAQWSGYLDQILKAGAIARTLGGTNRDVEFHETALVVIESQTGDLVGAAPDFHGSPLAILTNGVVAESHGREIRMEKM